MISPNASSILAGFVSQTPPPRHCARAYVKSSRDGGGYCDLQLPSQLLNADALTNVISERWESETEHEDKRKQKVLGKLNTMWREWIYAWDHYDQP